MTGSPLERLRREFILWLLDRDPEYAAALIKRFGWKKP